MIFPYKFSSEANLFYIGKTPDSRFFNSLGDWEKFKLAGTFDFRNYSIQYCMRDVEITSGFLCVLKQLLKSLKINFESTYSAPSLSLKIFNKNFNENRVSFRHNFLLEKFIRPSYYGGRCEVYGNPIKEEYIFHSDFSGMYGQCMKQKFVYGAYKINNKVSEINKPGFY
jgi:hypothetical protein